MKANIFLPLPLALFFLGAIFFSGCSLYPTKSTPSKPTPPTGNTNGPEILASITRQNTTSSAQVIITQSSAFVTNATVNLVTPSYGTISVAFNSGSSDYLNSDGSWAYEPGGIYTFHISIGSTQYTGSVQAPGGITIPGTGSPISWTTEGNEDVVSVYQEFSPNTNTTFGPNANSPVNTSSAFTASGSYLVQASCIEEVQPFSSAYPASTITATDQQMAIVTH